jgi:hypothetical protein
MKMYFPHDLLAASQDERVSQDDEEDYSDCA